jgi:hypothetical protein
VNRLVLGVLPGQPTDGTGRLRIHYFARDPAGPLRLPVRVEPTPVGPLRLGGACGRIACRPALAALSRPEGGVTREVLYSDDVRGVTCPDCQGTDDYRKAAAALAGAAPNTTAPPGAPPAPERGRRPGQDLGG